MTSEGRTYGKITIETADNGYILRVQPPEVSPMITAETVHEGHRSLLRQINIVLDEWKNKKTK